MTNALLLCPLLQCTALQNNCQELDAALRELQQQLAQQPQQQHKQPLLLGQMSVDAPTTPHAAAARLQVSP